MVDVTSLILLSISFFFVALSVGLLVKFREVSVRINASTDLGRDLWLSLEQRLKKQDERILDMMGRLEVVQSRVISTSAVQASVLSPVSSVSRPATQAPDVRPIESHVQKVSVQQPESQESQMSQWVAEPSIAGLALDETQMAALKLLSEAPRNTRQLTDALGKSREHTARIMKELFEAGLVLRDAASKPFVYQLTDEGRARLAAS